MDELSNYLSWIYYLIPVVFVGIYWRLTKKKHKSNLKQLETAKAEGLAEPASLHPIIDETKCLACKACVSACPEDNVLGIINNKAQLINASHCIGHGACQKACPFRAITLVFGTATRGVDIPFVEPSFETNVPGIYIAGELGGMGLIKNAIEQGKQAAQNIIKTLNKSSDSSLLDIFIVGAGPSGFSATLAAHDKNLRYRTIDQDSFGGTVFKFPRGKIVMTSPVDLPIIGKQRLKETTKEALLEFWKKVIDKTGIRFNTNESLESVTPINEGFKLKTNKGEYKTQKLLLCIGRRGSPRKLNVPGEEQEKVVYQLIDPEQYKHKKVLVVGGGDSALEAALSIAEQPGTTVTLSYRSGAFSRAKPKNRKRIDDAELNNSINILYSSNVKEIQKSTVVVKTEDDEIALENDAVIISAGGILPTGFLKSIGVEVETKYGEA